MALSGRLTTNAPWDGRYFTLDWSATQNVAGNYSDISWTLSAVGGNHSWYTTGPLVAAINGYEVYRNNNRVNMYAGVVASGTYRLTHKSDGTSGSIVFAVAAAVYYSSTNIDSWYADTINTIPRASTWNTCNNGTLGTNQTVTINRASSSFRTTITYNCGGTTGTLINKADGTSFTINLPVNLSVKNTTGTTVSVTLYLYTYSGNTQIGSTQSKTITMTIPSSVAPTANNIGLSDPTGYAGIYGVYVAGKSKLTVTGGGSGNQSSSITNYYFTVGGTNYSYASSATSYAITLGPYNAGTVNASYYIKDSRGRTSTSKSGSVSFVSYSSPSISKLSVLRTNSYGTEDMQGEYAKITFSYSIQNINNKNQNLPKATLYYRQSGTSSWTQAVQYSDYSRSNTTFGPFAAATDKSYDVRLVVSDRFTTIEQITSVSTAFCLYHIPASGRTISFGGISDAAATATKFQVKNMQPEFSSAVYAPDFVKTSSRLIKENIEDLTDEEAKKVLSLRPVNFDYVEGFGGSDNVGLIAEEVLDIYPFCVNIPDGYDPNQFDATKGVGGNLILGIDYSALVPELIKMVQILYSEVEELKKERSQ